MDRVMQHHVAAAWLAAAYEIRDDWIAGRLTHKATADFTAWAIEEISRVDHVAGIDPETGNARDDASQQANDAYETSWAVFWQLKQALFTLEEAPIFGGDDQETIRKMLINTERDTTSGSGNRRAGARLLRDQFHIPLSCHLSDGPG